MPKQEPIAELLAAADALEIAWITGADDRKARERFVRARRAVGQVVASNEQLAAVLERQIASLFRPVVNERLLCEILGCSRTWLWDERKQGRWLNFEVDARGARHYTPEQILANLRGERLKPNLKAA